ncbi:phosphatase PAP2 family protein [Fibrobacter sp. UWB7]|uniref:acid phosphatase n=1 Tax=Fibrobacter sp. UWB7 TaxID=1896206 RepID=UPI000911AA54|nr:phosphatase PAP2 family protein [Fibrobacter sp. UWB7]SHM10714.1 acid phosphatase (class A) [Fibrobacter sp. UWB7]
MITLLQKSVFALAICGATLCSFAANAKPYMNADALPNALNFYPAPPETTSVQFMYDISQYMWGKAMRADSARAALAVAQAVETIEDMAKMFSEPFGMEISAKKTPAIMNMLERGIRTLKQVGSLPKRHYMRRRPYDRFNESTLVPAEEERLRTNGSYPSGHTVRAWSMALLLVEVNPAAQDALLKYAYEWGQSRVIAGFHWQSDVDASKVLVSAAFASLHNDETFLADMKKARAEFKKLSAKKK